MARNLYRLFKKKKKKKKKKKTTHFEWFAWRFYLSSSQAYQILYLKALLIIVTLKNQSGFDTVLLKSFSYTFFYTRLTSNSLIEATAVISKLHKALKKKKKKKKLCFP